MSEFDWYSPPTQIADRCPWYVLHDGRVLIGPKGAVHDDMLADAELEESEIAGRGEYWPDTGRIEQLRPLGTEFSAQVEDALDEGLAQHLSATGGGVTLQPATPTPKDSGWEPPLERTRVGKGSKRPTPFNVSAEGLVTFLKPGEMGQGLIVPVGKLYRIEGVDPSLHHHVHRAWTQTLESPDLDKKQAADPLGGGTDGWAQAESHPSTRVQVPGAAPGLQPVLQGAEVPAQGLPGGLCRDCNGPLDGEEVCPHCFRRQPQPPALVRSLSSRRNKAEPHPRAPALGPGRSRAGHAAGRSCRGSSCRRSPSDSSVQAEGFLSDGHESGAAHSGQRADKDAVQVGRVAFGGDQPHRAHDDRFHHLTGRLLLHAGESSNFAAPVQADSSYWVYLDGQVKFDRYPWRAARDLAMQSHPEKADYISNTIARNDIPSDIDCAVGQLLGNRPQIWMSSVDRNAVWDAVIRALDTQGDSANRYTTVTVANPDGVVNPTRNQTVAHDAIEREPNKEVKSDDVVVLNEYKQDYRVGDPVETPHGYGVVTEAFGKGEGWRVKVDGHEDIYSADELRLVLHNPANAKRASGGEAWANHVTAHISQHAYAAIARLLGPTSLSSKTATKLDTYAAVHNARLHKRIGGFFIVAADIDQLAQATLDRLEARPDIAPIMDDSNDLDPRNDARRKPGPTYDIYHFLGRCREGLVPPETYKMWEWLVGQFKRGNASWYDNHQHILDILSQATKWMQWCDQQHQPAPDWKRKEFKFSDMQNWVYEMNSKDNSSDSQWQGEHKIMNFEDGWYLSEVPSEDCGLEGELMGHCVGGYGYQIDNGQSYIVSLRDPKGQPHVTLEMVGQKPMESDGHTPMEGETWEVNQVMGKQDRKPIEEYRQYIKEWFDQLKSEGLDIRWAKGSAHGEPDGNDYDEPEYIAAANDVEVKKPADVVDALHTFEREGMGSFWEDGETQYPMSEGHDPDYDIDGYFPTPTQQRRNTVHVRGPHDNDAGQGSDLDNLIVHWKTFIKQLLNGKISDPEDVAEYVQGFYFIPKTDKDGDQWYGHPLMNDEEALRRKQNQGVETKDIPHAYDVWADAAHEVMAEQPVPKRPINPAHQPQLFDWNGMEQPVTHPQFERGRLMVQYALKYMAALYRGYETLHSGDSSPYGADNRKMQIRDIQRGDGGAGEWGQAPSATPYYKRKQIRVPPGEQLMPQVNPPHAELKPYVDPYQVKHNDPLNQPNRFIPNPQPVPTGQGPWQSYLPESQQRYERVQEIQRQMAQMRDKESPSYQDSWYMSPEYKALEAELKSLRMSSVTVSHHPLVALGSGGQEWSDLAMLPDTLRLASFATDGLRVSFDVPYDYEGYTDPHHGEVPPRMYHVAPTHARDSILASGLDATGRTWNTGGGPDLNNWKDEKVMFGDGAYEWRPEGVYMFNNHHDARGYAGFYNDTTPAGAHDIWEINTRALPSKIIRDPSRAFNWGWDADDDVAYVTKHVPPHALRLVDPDEHLAGLNGALPEGLQISEQQAGTFLATLNGENIGRLLIDGQKQIHVQVMPAYQRLGIATALLERLQQTYPEFVPSHSRLITPEGLAWAQQQPNVRWPNEQTVYPTTGKPYERRTSSGMNHFGDYNGWTNWATWHTALMMDNDEPTYRESRKLMERGWTVEQLRDWCIVNILGPHNKQSIEDAQEWNDIPEHERLDPHYEDLKERNPQAADIVDSLGFGADTSDTDPMIMDEHLINWQEIWDHLYEEIEENMRYERMGDKAREHDIEWYQPGSDPTEPHNLMIDAWMKHHGIMSQEQRLENGAHAGYHTILQLGDDQLPAGKRLNSDYWGRDPESYEQPDKRPMSVNDYGWDTVGDIQRGRANPYQAQTMQQALLAQGRTPEQIAEIMKQRWRWDGENWNDLDKQPPVTDASLDQPGDTTMPEHWGSVKLTTRTRTQLMAEKARFDSVLPDKGIVHHRFPNGWHIYEPGTQYDAAREGTLMENCTTDDGAPQLQQAVHNGVQTPAWSYDKPYRDEWGTLMTLRDPDNLPHAFWTVGADNSYGEDAEGRRGQALKPEYAEMLRQHYDPKGDPEEWWERFASVRTAMVAMTTLEGTAVDEAALCTKHDSPANRAKLEASAMRIGDIVPGSWTDVSDNEYIQCTLCGMFDEDSGWNDQPDLNEGLRSRNLFRSSAVDPQLWQVVMRALHKFEGMPAAEVTPDALFSRMIVEVMDAYPPNARPSNEEISAAAQMAVQSWNAAKGEGGLNTERYVQQQHTPINSLIPDGLEEAIPGWTEPSSQRYMGEPRSVGWMRWNKVAMAERTGQPCPECSTPVERYNDESYVCPNCKQQWFEQDFGKFDKTPWAPALEEGDPERWPSNFPQAWHDGKVHQSMAERTGVPSVQFEHEYDPDWGDHYLFAKIPGANVSPTEGQPLEGADGEKRLPGGDVVGMIKWNEDSHGIAHVEVHPDYQRQGIARLLYQKANETAGPVSLDNDYSNEGAAWAGRMRESNWHPLHHVYGAEGSQPYLDDQGGWQREFTSAAPQVMYHRAPRNARDSILKNGIDHRIRFGDTPPPVDTSDVTWAPRGNYLGEMPEHAVCDDPNADLWEVNVQGLSLTPDEAWYKGWYTTALILPDRLRLLEPQEPRTGNPQKVWQPGETAYFEYHCYEGHDSSDAQAWYRSHQPVTILEEHGPDKFEPEEGTGPQHMYTVQWADGHTHSVFDDELLDSPNEYTRPDPPAPRVAALPAQPGHSHPELWGPMKIDQAAETPTFSMPEVVEQRFVDARECPECKNVLADRDGSGLQCTYCGWRPKGEAPQ